MSKLIRKKLTCFAVFALLALSLVPLVAFAEVNSNLTLDNSITVSGLVEGDSAQYYKIIEQNPYDNLYVKAKSFDENATYYTKLGNDYEKANGVTSETFSNDTYYILVAMNDWKFTKAVDFDQDGFIDNSDYAIEDFVINSVSEKDAKIINAKMANAICSALTTNKEKSPNPVNPTVMGLANSEGKITINQASTLAKDWSGLYMVEASAGENNTQYVYKPIFVSTDYYSSGNDQDSTNSITLIANPDENLSDGLSPTDYEFDRASSGAINGVFKKSKLEIVKTSGTDADNQRDVAVGDIVQFTIKVPVPTYTNNYNRPFFMITDRLTDGLELCYVEDGQQNNEPDINVAIVYDNNTSFTFDDSEVFIGVKENKQLFTILLNEELLKRVTGVPMLTITYTAEVTSDAFYQVNQIDNTAVVTFANDPKEQGPETGDPNENGGNNSFANNPNNPFDPNDDPNDPDSGKFKDPTDPDYPVNPYDGTSTLKDKTRHYTFGLDANILRPDNSKTPENVGEEYDKDIYDIETREIEKVGVEADGQVDEITQYENYPVDSDSDTVGDQPYSPLSGATFQLKPYLDNQGAIIRDMDTTSSASLGSALKFTNGLQDPTNGSSTLTSAADGSITAKGLDAGVYRLVETGCPLGYTYDPSVYYDIEIAPEYELEEPEENEILVSYTVKIRNSKTGYSSERTYYVKQDEDDIDGDGDDEEVVSLLDNAGNNVVVEYDIDVLESTSGQLDQTVTVVPNKKLGLLPATGGSGILFYVGIGAALMTLAIVLAIRGRRKKARATE